MKELKERARHCIIFQNLMTGLFEGLQVKGLRREALSASPTSSRGAGRSKLPDIASTGIWYPDHRHSSRMVPPFIRGICICPSSKISPTVWFMAIFRPSGPFLATQTWSSQSSKTVFSNSATEDHFQPPTDTDGFSWYAGNHSRNHASGIMCSFLNSSCHFSYMEKETTVAWEKFILSNCLHASSIGCS